MAYHPSHRIEIDCRHREPPKEGQIFTLHVTRPRQYMVVSITEYTPPIRRPDGTTATHLIHYIPKPKP
jgi:hypothetical protein